jgi:phosphoribosyl 1,2-cyclic phosphodiesterase
MLSVRFWGSRGSITCPGPDTVIFGGNTSCLEIRADERLLIVDLGTGIRLLGDWLMVNDLKKKGCIDADIFITHTHWDHIMGFPAFSPIFVSGTKLRIRGPVSFEDDSLATIVSAQLSYRYWPVRAAELAADIKYYQIQETALDLGGGLHIIAKYLNHPILCLGYRFEYQGKSIIAAFDHEPFRNVFPTDPSDPGYNEEAAKEGELAVAEENEKIHNFFRGADILIHDAQYTATEYASHLGWGHSSFDQAVNSAVNAGVKKLVFYHHDPARTDAQLEQLEKSYMDTAAPQIMMAREGLIVEA